MKSGKKEILEGLIIQSFPYGENHKIINLFTRHHGVLSLLAHGARKQKSKTRGRVETLNHIECLAHQTGKNPLRTLMEVSVKQAFAPTLKFEALWETLPFLKLLRYLHFSSIEENDKIFQMLIRLLEILSQAANSENRRLLLEAFVLKTWIMTGMMPNPRICARCGNLLTAEEVYWNPAELSTACQEIRFEKDHFLRLSPDFYEKLIQIIYLKFDELLYLIIDRGHALFLRQMTEQILTNTIHKGWKEFETGENPFSDEPQIR